jgi:hypothetical protein
MTFDELWRANLAQKRRRTDSAKRKDLPATRSLIVKDPNELQLTDVFPRVAFLHDGGPMATSTLSGNAKVVRRDRAYDNYFFSAMALLILATVLVGCSNLFLRWNVPRPSSQSSDPHPWRRFLVLDSPSDYTNLARILASG